MVTVSKVRNISINPVVRATAGQPLLYSKWLEPSPSGEYCSIFRRGKIRFIANPNRKYYKDLVDGDLRVDYYSTHVVLCRKTSIGRMEELDRVCIEQGFYCRNNGCILSNGKGLKAFPSAKTTVSADLLFEEFETTAREVFFNHINSDAFFRLFRLQIDMPVDDRSLLGQAVREKKVYVEGNRKKISFYQRLEQGKLKCLGEIAIDDDGYLLLPSGERYQYKGQYPNLRFGLGVTTVKSWELLECFALKDYPVVIAPSSGRAVSSYKNVHFEFSTDLQGIYYSDLVAGRLFLRAGLKDRIQVVRKIAGEEDQVLGEFMFDEKGKILASAKGTVLGEEGFENVGNLIEEMAGKEVPISRSQDRNGAMVATNYVRLYFPLRAGVLFTDLVKRAELVVRVYNRRIVIGRRKESSFFAAGEMEITPKGLIKVQGCEEAIVPASCGESWKYINIGKLFPHLLSSSFSHQAVVFKFNLTPKDLLFDDVFTRNIVWKTWGDIVEFYRKKADGVSEFLGVTWFDQSGVLMGSKGSLVKFRAKPVTRDSKVRLSIKDAVPVFGIDEYGLLFFAGELASTGIATLRLEQNSNYYDFYKKVLMLGWYLLKHEQNNIDVLLRVTYLTAQGIKRLIGDKILSNEAIIALRDEAFSLLETAYLDPNNRKMRDSMTFHLENAYRYAQKLKEERFTY